MRYYYIFFLFLPFILKAQEVKLIVPTNHTDAIYFAKFTLDGTKIMTYSGDKTAKLWDVRTGQLLKEFRDYIDKVEFSADGKRILIVSRGVAKLWDIQNAQLLFESAHNKEKIILATINWNGTQIAFSDNYNNLTIWNIDNNSMLYKVTEYSAYIKSISFNIKGTNVLAAFEDGMVRIWDLRGRKLLSSINVLSKKLNFANFSLDGGKIITCHANTATIWDINTSLSICRLIGHSDLILNAEFSSNGKLIATASEDETAKIWDANTGSLIHTFRSSSDSGYNAEYLPYIKEKILITDDVRSVAFNSTGTRVITASGRYAKVWDIATGKILYDFKGHKEFICSAQFNADGTRAVTASVDRTAKIWDAKTGRILHNLNGHSSNVVSADMSPDKKKMVIAYGDSSAKIWDANSGRLLHNLKGHKKEVLSAKFNPNGKTIITCSYDSTAKIWDAENGHLLLNLDVYSLVSNAVFNLDGTKVLTYSSDLVKIWDTNTGTLLYNFNDSNIKPITCLDFSKTGNLLAIGSFDFVKILDGNTGTLLHDLKEFGYLRLVRFSPDNSKLASMGDKSVKIWDTKSGLLLYDFEQVNGVLESVNFSSDGKKLITSCGTKEAMVWSIETGMPLYTLQGHTDNIYSAMFSVDGKKIITASMDKTAKIWNAETGLLINTIMIGRASVITYFDSSTLIAINNEETKLFNLDKGNNLLSLYSLDSSDFISLLPNGYYQSSANAAKLLSYATSDLKVIAFEQLDVKYNRPDKVLEAISSTDTSLINSYKKAYQKRIRKLGIDTTQFKNGYSVPESDFINRDAVEYEQTKDKLQLKIKGNDSSYKLDRFNIWVNEVPLFGLKGNSLKTRNKNQFDTSLTITLSQGENRIETSITNANGTESYRMPLFAKYTPAILKEPKLHFIGIGINQFANSDYNLNWSAKDIRDLSLKLKSKYPNIIIDTLFDNNVTKENILALKQKLLLLNEDDKVIVSYSGHGVLSKDFDYYLSTYSINFNTPEEKGLAYDDLESLLDNIKPRQKLMLIDACHSGEVDKEEIAKIEASKKSFDSSGIAHKSTIKVVPKKNIGMANSFELMQSLFVNVGKGTGATIISAAGGMQYAQERGDLKNGVFTYSIIEAFNNNPSLKVSELKKIVGARVTQLTNGLQKPTSRNETNNYDWVVW